MRRWWQLRRWTAVVVRSDGTEVARTIGHRWTEQGAWKAVRRVRLAPGEWHEVRPRGDHRSVWEVLDVEYEKVRKVTGAAES